MEYILKKFANYPKYPNTKFGETLLLNIRKYLISKNNNKKIVEYPKYITEADDAENQKHYFRNISHNYTLDKYNNLYIKYNQKKEIIMN